MMFSRSNDSQRRDWQTPHFRKTRHYRGGLRASSIAMWRPFYYLPLRLTNQLVFRTGLSLQSVGFDAH